MLKKVGSYRWRICALLFFATTINYVDRNVLSFILLNDDFKRDMLGLAAGTPLTNAHHADFKEWMGYVDSAFKFAYALGFLITGWFIDKVGVFKGYSMALLVWVGSALSHGLVNNIKGLGLVRLFLGIGEAGNFPSAIKTVAEWFPKKERSLATGIFNAGANVGIIATAFTVPWIASVYGWRAAFLLTSSLGIILFVLWRITYKSPAEHPRLSEAERSYILQDQDVQNASTKLAWSKLFPFSQTWAFAVGKFFTDCIWWFYIFWLPSFFAENAHFKLNLKPDFQSWQDVLTIGLPFLVIYIVSDLGSVGFGWLSSFFLKKGWSSNKARKITMLCCALLVVPIFFASQTENLWVAVTLIALAAAAHQGWSANLFTMVSDMFPKRAVASVVGIGGMFGALGGMILAALSGILIKHMGYVPLFILAAGNYLLALLLIHILAPALQPVQEWQD
ncbi:MAG: MFS transporter [Cytophagaceae bacterium]|jgi:ACS family hexuronate transporter-like MFS transporter|nr:MFS transporter [Cytophagaceae bacterium]